MKLFYDVKPCKKVVKYSEPIRHNQYYYAFDYQVLKLLGLRVKQGVQPDMFDNESACGCFNEYSPNDE